MKFPFKSFRTTLPVPSLGGAMFRRKPVISVVLTGPSGVLQPDVLLDTGSDDVVFPMSFAPLLGAQLDPTTSRQAAGAGTRQPVGLLYAPMILEVKDAVQACRWRAVVAFTTAKLIFPLFGFAGGLQYFRTICDMDADEIVLDPRASLPATQAAVP